MKFFKFTEFTFGLLLIAELAHGQATCLGARALIVTHPSSLWDRNKVIESAVNSLAESFIKDGLPVIRIVDSAQSLGTYYLKFFSKTIESVSGSHSLCFAGNEVVVTGGKFSMCSSETVRDILVNSAPFASKIEITVAMNAIYEPETAGSYPFKELGDPLSLKDLTRNFSDSQFSDFLERVYFSKNGLGQQNPFGKPEASFQQFSFRIMRNGQLIGTKGIGTKIVNLNFRDEF